MTTRRQILKAGASLLAGTVATGAVTNAATAQSRPTATQPPIPAPSGQQYTPVVTLNGSSLPWKMDNGVKVFHLIAEPCTREFAPGMTVNCWGYNGATPGPTIEAVEGDRVRILVTNRLPEHTSIHWHGILLPNGMDGVSGLTQKPIPPGDTFKYEFTLNQHGTLMYHPHYDEMLQMAMGMMGFLIIHPKNPPAESIVQRDFAIMLMEWAIDPGTFTPNPMIMTDFNTFTFNSRIFPGIDPLVVKLGDRVRIRIGNLSMNSHPIHLHGHAFEATATDSGPIPPSARFPENTISIPVGTTRDIEFVADNPGDWALHCHKSHHTMNSMAHDVPNLIGASQAAAAEKIARLVPTYMQMGSNGMGEMAEMHMPGPKNTPPMMTGTGPFGAVGMGGMFTILKVRAGITSYNDPGWYAHPEGTLALPVNPDH